MTAGANVPRVVALDKREFDQRVRRPAYDDRYVVFTADNLHEEYRFPSPCELESYGRNLY